MKNFNLGQIISIFANVGVIAGIIFLALELQQTRLAIASQAYQGRAFDAIDWDLEVAGNDRMLRLATLIETGRLDIDSLSVEERVAASFMLETLLVDLDNEHFQYENGFLDEGFYENGTVYFVRKYAPIWRRAGLSEQRPSFRDEVDRVLAVQPESEN